MPSPSWRSWPWPPARVCHCRRWVPMPAADRRIPPCSRNGTARTSPESACSTGHRASETMKLLGAIARPGHAVERVIQFRRLRRRQAVARRCTAAARLDAALHEASTQRRQLAGQDPDSRCTRNCWKIPVDLAISSISRAKKCRPLACRLRAVYAGRLDRSRIRVMPCSRTQRRYPRYQTACCWLASGADRGAKERSVAETTVRYVIATNYSAFRTAASGLAYMWRFWRARSTSPAVYVG